MLTLQIIAIALAGILDRIRGDAWHFFGARFLDKAALGYCMAVVAGFPADMLITPLIVLAMTIGMSWGWGAPMGAALTNTPMDKTKLEWWQVGPLKTNTWLALTFRGALWGAPVALVGILAPSLVWFVPAYAVAFPLSIVVANKLEKGWGDVEYIRGWMAALLVFTSTFV